MRRLRGGEGRKLLFKKFGCVGHTVVAVAERLAGTHTLQMAAHHGGIALAEAPHDAFHGLHGLDAVAGGETYHSSCAHKGAAGAFEIAHAGAIGVGCIAQALLVEAGE